MSLSNVRCYNNLTVNSGGNAIGSYGTVTAGNNVQNSITSGFINSAGGDYHLNSSATFAIGQGANLSSDFNYDKDGKARATPWSIGPYQYGAAAANTNITVNAGGDTTVTLPATASLTGAVVNPLGGVLGLAWSKISGPGTVTFSAPSAAATTATFSSAGTYVLRITATVLLVSASDDVTVTVNAAPAPTGMSFQAESGTITAPFTVANGAISQSVTTDVTTGGTASYVFTVPTNGTYVVSALMNAPSAGENSIYINVDATPTDPTMIWDIPVTSGFENRTASWRGGGTIDTNEFSPKIFTLSAGQHSLIIIGREADVALDTIQLQSAPLGRPLPPANLTVILP
jgi:hypothetical protein